MPLRCHRWQLAATTAACKPCRRTTLTALPPHPRLPTLLSPSQDGTALLPKVQALEAELARVAALQAAVQASLASLASGLNGMNLPGAPRQARRMLAHKAEAAQGRALQGYADGCTPAGMLSPDSAYCCSGKRFLLTCL